MILAVKVFLSVLLALGGIGLARSLAGWEQFAHWWNKPVDQTDCYFDKECHAKVNWDKVTELKKSFFENLKILKEKHDTSNVQPLVIGMHKDMALTGIPEDRIDYILTKWLDYTFPEAVQVNYAKSSIVVSGFACDNGYGQDLNQKYEYQGVTSDGRPYYRGTARPDRYIYYDSYCADDTREPRWLLGGKPEVTREFGLNVNDGEGCENDFSIVTGSNHLPGGFQRVAWNWCGDHGLHDSEAVSITYDLVKESAHQQKSPQQETERLIV
jgi:hypothetical protein